MDIGVGVALIQKEREEQIYKHGRTLSKDRDENKSGALRKAAIALIANHGEGDISQMPLHWDDEIVRHMMSKPYKERCVIAATFLAAEVDRVS